MEERLVSAHGFWLPSSIQRHSVQSYLKSTWVNKWGSMWSLYLIMMSAKKRWIASKTMTMMMMISQTRAKTSSVLTTRLAMHRRNFPVLSTFTCKWDCSKSDQTGLSRRSVDIGWNLKTWSTSQCSTCMDSTTMLLKSMTKLDSTSISTAMRWVWDFSLKSLKNRRACFSP